MFSLSIFCFSSITRNQGKKNSHEANVLPIRVFLPLLTIKNVLYRKRSGMAFLYRVRLSVYPCFTWMLLFFSSMRTNGNSISLL